MPLLSDDMIPAERVENGIVAGLILGSMFLVLNAVFGRAAKARGGRVAKVFVELQRKSFHMVGGCIICGLYYWGVKLGYLGRADQPSTELPLDGGQVCFAACLVCWMMEAARLMVPFLRDIYLNAFNGLIREKEKTKAAGIAYFLPGSLAAMLAAPPHIAVLCILFLSVGDAAASLGTAGGRIPVGTSPRKVEGSIGCFLVCTGISVYMGLDMQVALIASAIVTFGEILAEIIGVDDNVVIPIAGVVGIRVGLDPRIGAMISLMFAGLTIGIGLGALVAATTPAAATKKKGEPAIDLPAVPQKKEL